MPESIEFVFIKDRYNKKQYGRASMAKLVCFKYNDFDTTIGRDSTC